MRKALFVIIVIVLLLIINNLTRSIYDVWQKKDLVSDAQKELEYQKQQNQRLKSELSYSKTEEFIEKEARNRLFMTKEGEERVILPKESENLPDKEKIKEKIPNWKMWWELFF
jgi:cell division protein FtsB